MDELKLTEKEFQERLRLANELFDAFVNKAYRDGEI